MPRRSEVVNMLDRGELPLSIAKLKELRAEVHATDVQLVRFMQAKAIDRPSSVEMALLRSERQTNYAIMLLLEERIAMQEGL